VYGRIYIVSLYLYMIIKTFTVPISKLLMSFSAKHVIDNNRFISSKLVSGGGGGFIHLVCLKIVESTVIC